jgi:hypothetical protein
MMINVLNKIFNEVFQFDAFTDQSIIWVVEFYWNLVMSGFTGEQIITTGFVSLSYEIWQTNVEWWSSTSHGLH